MFVAATNVCQAESSNSQTDNTTAIIGGVVVAVVSVALILAVTVIVIVILVLRGCRGNYSTSTTKTRLFKVLYFYTCHCVVYRGAVGVTNQSLELSKFSEATEATYV